MRYTRRLFRLLSDSTPLSFHSQLGRQGSFTVHSSASLFLEMRLNNTFCSECKPLIWHVNMCQGINVVTLASDKIFLRYSTQQWDTLYNTTEIAHADTSHSSRIDFFYCQWLLFHETSFETINWFIQEVRLIKQQQASGSVVGFEAKHPILLYMLNILHTGVSPCPSSFQDPVTEFDYQEIRRLHSLWLEQPMHRLVDSDSMHI